MSVRYYLLGHLNWLYRRPRGQPLLGRAKSVFARLLPQQMRPDVVVSFPKSGRTWLRVMLDDLDCPIHYVHARSRCTEIAKEFQRIVFLHRDPRDTVVSSYYEQTVRKGAYSGTLGEFIRDPYHGIENIVGYQRIWFELARRRLHILTVSYESLRADTAGELIRILVFLRRPVDLERVVAVASNNSFARMQARERSGFYLKKYGRKLTPLIAEDTNSFKVRKGKIGGFREELNEDDLAYCEMVMAITYQPGA